MIESNHYASGHVRGVAARLDKTWKDFAGCLDERTTVLALSVLFHQKAESVRQTVRFLCYVHTKRNSNFQYMDNVPKWSQGCDAANTPSSSSSSGGNGGGGGGSDGNSSSTSAAGEIPALESSIHQHQSLYESMCQAYTEVHSTSKKLLYQLDHLVQLANQSGAMTAGAGGEERKHVSYTISLTFKKNFCPFCISVIF